ncbi:hypothetical protein PCC7424_4623 [Gloeothece citriformis PCC 7424]|uniref:Uncharacterized protein n=1 Tax=Gloeothece citriformis (strain PCC 7424) TaxID=65393 RepID=B7KBK7_GLOC7|nr:hypothetical protein [Gloeothece citriformis]ACK72985.1 hypothetical protein PCC7424_4623 [Gloeothece citriformis PCC 7424]
MSNEDLTQLVEFNAKALEALTNLDLLGFTTVQPNLQLPDIFSSSFLDLS